MIKNILNDTKTIIMNNVTVFILLNALWGLYYTKDGVSDVVFWLLIPTLCVITSSIIFSNAFDNNMSIKKIIGTYTKSKLMWMMKAQIVWISTLLTITAIGYYLSGSDLTGDTSLSYLSTTILALLFGFSLMYHSVHISLISCIEEGFGYVATITINSLFKHCGVLISFTLFYGMLLLLLQGIWMVMVVPAFYIGMAYTLRYVINQPPKKREKVVVLETCTDV